MANKVSHIVDWTVRNIRIESYPTTPHWGRNPYHSLTIYPAQYIIAKCSVGSLVDKGVITKRVKESLNISKRLNPASMIIETLLSCDGLLFDHKDRLVTPSFSVESGMLKVSQDCTGSVA